MARTIKRLRKGRCLVVFTALIILLSMFGGSFDAQANDSASLRELQPVIVESGDTLWQLVNNYYAFSGDIREAIHEVKEINGLKNSALIPGQIVYIPAE